ncbi:MAG: serine protease [Patescibacteria group bacterium]|nr:serine protease [Patescibacteria group bacterium]
MKACLPDEQQPLFAKMVRSTVQIESRDMEKIGAGVLISPTGLILTADHVVGDVNRFDIRPCRLEKWRIKLLKRMFDVEVVYRDERADIAVLLIKEGLQGAVHAEIDYGPTKAGAGVYRVGTDRIPMASGHVYTFWNDMSVRHLAISMTAENGCSGGPIFNDDLKLVGIAVRATDDLKLPTTCYAVQTRTIHSRILFRRVVKQHLPEDLRKPR